MAPQSGVFPIFLRAEYREDGQGFSRFQSDAARAAQAAKREFQGVAAALDEALARPRNSVGSLDLGLDELRQAAAQQERIAAAARQVAEATNRARAATSGYDEQLSKATQAAFRLAQAEEAKGREMLEQVEILERVQQELNQTAAATDEVIAAQRRGTTARGNVINSVRAERVAFVQLGQQLQDITVQAQAGTDGFLIFSQQIPQAAFALSGLRESSDETLSKIGEFATFLSGPWGAALFAATAVLGPFISDLITAGDESEVAAEKSIVFASSVDVVSLSVENATSRLDEMIGRLRSAIKLQGDFLRGDAELARKQVEDLRRQIKEDEAIVAQFKKERDEDILGLFVPTGVIPGSARSPGRGFEVSKVQERLAANRDKLPKALEAAGVAAIAEANRNIAESLDPIQAKINGIDESIARLNQRRLDTITRNDPLGDGNLTQAEFERQLSNLAGQRRALENEQREAKRTPRRARQDRSEERRRREVERLADFGEKAAEQIQRINERFDEQPRLIDQAAQATRQLDAITADLEKRKPPNFEKLIADAEAAKITVQDALLRPFEQLREESQQRLQIESLLAQGQFDRASALQDIFRLEQQLGPLTREQREDVEGIVVAEQQRLRVLRDQRAVFEAQLDVLDQVRSDLTAILSGRSTDFFGNFKQALLDLQGQRLFESIFGDAFRDIQNELQKSTPQGRANAAYVQQVERTAHATERVGNSAISLAEEFDRAFSIVRGAAEQTLTGTAANDNFSVDSITVTGDRGHTASGRRNGEVRIARPSVLDLAARISKGIGDSIAVELEDLLGARFAQTLGNIIGGFIGGKAVGGTPGGIIGALRGVLGAFADKDGKLSKTLASIDKALGGALAGTATGTQVAGLSKALGLGGSTTGAQIGGALGSFLPIPGGNIIGAVIGNFVGSLFKKTPRASATIGGVGDGLGITSLTGTNASLRNTAGDLGDSVLESINRIAQQLGADFNPAAGTVSIGQRKGNLRVDPTGRGITKVGNGAIDFGDDAEAAIAFAVRDLIQDGVITGLKQSEQNLLKAGKDVEAALADVLRFRSVFDQLDEIKDPVGFAVRSLNREFESLIDLFEKAGASAEEFASLEELYNLRRAEAIREATDRVVGSLRGLLNDLKIGDSGLSLRSRQQNALAEFNGLAARVAAGDATAFDDFADISRQLLEIERQLFGSTQSYFDRLAQVTALTEQAIADQTNVTSIGAGQPSPFDDRASIARAIEASNAEQVGWLRAINDNLIALNPNARPRSNIGGGGGGLVDGLLVNILANF
jgi:hypothetical protein